MTVQATVGGALFLISVGCVIRANALFREVVLEINRLLPAEREISQAGFVRHRFFEILMEYRRLYPNGKLVRKACIWTAVGFALFFGSAGLLFNSGAASTGYVLRSR